MSIKFKDNTKKLTAQIQKNMEETTLDILLDVKRTASESAPHKTGRLEKGFDHKMNVRGDTITGRVSVTAIEGGKDYAKVMHDTDYKLGTLSKRKPGGKSAYGGGRVKVGKGYLANTVEGAQEGYIKAYDDALQAAVNKYN